MKGIVIFGKNCTVIEKESDRDSFQFRNNKIFITSHERPAGSLLKEFLADLLYSQLTEISDRIRKEGKVGLFGDLDFEIVQNIDNKKHRVAKLKGNRVLVKLNAIALPKSVLKYIIAHEIAHIVTKRHTKKFWKTVELMCPDFEETQRLLTKLGDYVTQENWQYM